jgi:hypothetical protein
MAAIVRGAAQVLTTNILPPPARGTPQRQQLVLIDTRLWQMSVFGLGWCLQVTCGLH